MAFILHLPFEMHLKSCKNKKIHLQAGEQTSPTLGLDQH